MPKNNSNKDVIEEWGKVINSIEVEESKQFSNKATAIVSGHIWLDERNCKELEILTHIDTDKGCSDIFDDYDQAIIDQIEIDFESEFPLCETKDYYFMAIVKGEFVKYETYDGTDYDVEYEVIEIKDVFDVNHVNT